MKKLIAILMVLSSLLLFSCNSDAQEPTDLPTEPQESERATVEPTEKPTEKSTEQDENAVKSIEDMQKLDDVISVERLEFSADIKGAVAYKMIFKSGELKIAADIVLPKDYAEKGSKYPVLFYFPTAQALIENLASGYATNGICVVRMYERGFGESEGSRDFGGEDLADAQKLIEICDSTEFMKDSKMFVAGASSGSIIAMRLISEDSARRLSGCAVSDVIADLKSYADFRGESIQNLFARQIGGTYEDMPEEYEKRSAMSFYKKLDRPMLIIHYEQSPLCQAEQTDQLHGLVYRYNAACLYKKYDLAKSDFVGESLDLLVMFIKEFM